MVRHEGLEGAIEFQEGNAEALLFPDDSFDVTMSVTVMEEANADRMLAEMVRVTRPGGRIAAIVRAQDLPGRVNIPLRAELKAKLEVPGAAGAVAGGCADASLYSRFQQVGLSRVQMLPDTIVYTNPRGSIEQTLLGSVLGTLGPEEVRECREAIDQAESEGTFFRTSPLHCAVGTKPS